MSESSRIIVETAFNVIYLIIVWWLVTAMYLRRAYVAQEDRRTAGLIMWAFFWLGLGDIGHVGFRVVAFALGGLETSVTLFGQHVRLAPMGSLATAITFTFFYVIMVMLWKERFNKSYGLIAVLLFIIAGIRFLIMTHPANDWNSIQPQPQWAIYRNVPLMLMQIGVMYLIFRDAAARQDKTFTRIGIMILVSFVCYAPVIFLQQRVPMIGMLMIPKTIAYLVIAFLGFFELYKKRVLPDAAPAAASS